MKSIGTLLKSFAALSAIVAILFSTGGLLLAQPPTLDTHNQWNRYSIPYSNARITGNRLDNLIVSTDDAAAFGQVNELHKYDPLFGAFVAKTSFSDFQFSVEHPDGHQLALFRTYAAAHDNVIFVGDQGRGAVNNPRTWMASFDGENWQWSEAGYTRRSAQVWTDGQVVLQPKMGHGRIGRWVGPEPVGSGGSWGVCHWTVGSSVWGNIDLRSSSIGFHGEHVYMMTGRDEGMGVLGYSDDHGTNWVSLGYGPLDENQAGEYEWLSRNSIQVDGVDSFWVSIGYGLWRTTDGGETWQDFSIPEQHLLQDGEGNYQEIHDFIAFDANNIWVAGTGGLGLHYDGGQWTDFSNAAGFGTEEITNMTMTEDGRIWFSGRDGNIYSVIPEPSTLLLLGLSGLLLLKRRQL